MVEEFLLQAERTLEGAVIGMWAALIVAFLVGGWAQIRWGGSDSVRAHGVQSLLLWLTVVVGSSKHCLQQRNHGPTKSANSIGPAVFA